MCHELTQHPVETLYALPLTDATRPAIMAHCLGDCFRLQFGAMQADGYVCYVCRHSDCPHVEVEFDSGGVANSTGQPVKFRKLKEIAVCPTNLQ